MYCEKISSKNFLKNIRIRRNVCKSILVKKCTFGLHWIAQVNEVYEIQESSKFYQQVYLQFLVAKYMFVLMNHLLGHFYTTSLIHGGGGKLSHIIYKIFVLGFGI